MNFDLLNPERMIAASICFASMGVNRAEKNTPLALRVPSLGLPGCFCIIIVTQISCTECISV